MATRSSDRSLEQQCLMAVNRLISECKANVPPVLSVSNIDSNLIVLLFETITNVQIPDILFCTHKMEEAHNVQAVIDTLSLDLLGISLSHITGESVVAGNLVAIRNLLEVLEGVLMCTVSSTSDEKSKKSGLKRKVSHKRKNQSQLSSEKKKSQNKTGDSLNGASSIQRRIQRLSSKQPHSLDGLSKQLQKEKPRRLSSRIRQKHLEKEGKKCSTSEILSESSTKSPPAKVMKHSDRKIAAEKNKRHPDTLSDSLTKSPPAKLMKHSDKKMAAEKNKEHSDELDPNKVVSSKPQRKSPRHLKGTGIQSAIKPHFLVESTNSKTKSTITEKRSTASKISKRKSSKPASSENTEKPFKKEQEVEELYEKNLERKIRVIVEKNSYLTSRASHLKKWHLQGVRKPVRKTPISVCRKSFLLPHNLRHRSVPRTVLKRVATNKVQPHVNVRKQIDNNLPGTSKSRFIQELFEDFPGLELPPSAVNLITKKYQLHLTNMHTKAKNCLLKIPKTQTQAEEAASKQSALSNLLKKDVKQQQYMKEFKENKENEKKIKYYLRDARMQSAKMKHYCDEFRVEMRKKMQKRNFTEELIFEKVFEDALKIQKEQVDQLCQEVKETGENDARKHLIYLDALENLYQTQFSLMSETLASEKQDAQIRVKAEKQAMNAMQREFQEELKKEIRFMQQAIIECTEDTHFREMDAEQYKENLRKKLS